MIAAVLAAEAYVETALRLLRDRPEVSAQQVAYHACGRCSSASAFDLEADQALSASGLFKRANFINSNSFGITLWKANQ
jgi:hypothetical protein